MKVIRDIEVSFIYPALPIRDFDWQATRKGWDLSEPVGHGRTPVMAVANLLEVEEERAGD